MGMVVAALRIGKRKVALDLPVNPDIQEEFIKSVQGLAEEARLDAAFITQFEKLTQDPAFVARWEMDQEYARIEALLDSAAAGFREQDGPDERIIATP